MPLLNFKPMFVDHIRSGRKGHTIRATRKHPVKVGDKLYLYCGLRQKGAYRILPEPVICTKVERIEIDHEDAENGNSWSLIEIDGRELDLDEYDRLAIADGFSSHDDMMAFWKGRLPFTGNIIHWK
jgi:hypothetical protein